MGERPRLPDRQTARWHSQRSQVLAAPYLVGIAKDHKNLQLLMVPTTQIDTTSHWQYKRLCTTCGCHATPPWSSAGELPECLAAERSPRRCPIARLLRAAVSLGLTFVLMPVSLLARRRRDTTRLGTCSGDPRSRPLGTVGRTSVGLRASTWGP